MRRRSGALHCQSEQDFIQLASVSHNQIGVFYDQKTNKRVMHEFKATQEPNTHLHNTSISNPQHLFENSQQKYQGFEFRMETHAQSQERQELQKTNSEVKEEQTITVICESVPNTLSVMAKQEFLDTVDKRRRFDLAVKKIGKKVMKYWIIGKEELSKQPQLLNIYLQKSSIIIEEREGWRIIKNRGGQSQSGILGQWSGMLE